MSRPLDGACRARRNPGRREEELDTVEDLGMEEGEWERLDDDGRYKVVEVWAWERLEIYWKED